MTILPYQKTILTSQLLLDTKNPRFPEKQDRQNSAAREMIKTQGSKVLALAEHIATNGCNPANIPIVIPIPKGDGRYTVLDGNRRLTAIRLLENPRLATGLIDATALQRVKEISDTYKKNPLNELACIVFNSRKEADPWIQLIHRGESQGTGLVRWDGQVAARYDERRGIIERGARTSLQILDALKDNPGLSQTTREKIEKGKFPITSLTRLINTPYARKKIGLQIKEGAVQSFDPKTIKSLTQIVEDIGTEYITVSDIKRVEQRIEYIDMLFAPHPSKSQGTTSTPAQKNSASSQPSGMANKGSAPVKPRNSIIPPSFLATVTQTRVNDIFVELKRLDVDQYPNAGAVLLRVFIELSLDDFLEKTVHWGAQQIDNSKLADKLNAVANDLETKGIMNKQQLAIIRKAASGQTLLVASVKTLHGYVHNKHFSPIPSELKTTWDDFASFMSKIWPV